MPKTGCRIVVVDNQKYRWRIRRKPTYCQAAFACPLTFSIQHSDGGSLLLVEAEGPRPDNWVEKPSVVVTPAIVAAAIRQARTCGWRAGEVGPMFELKLNLVPNIGSRRTAS